MSKAAYLLYRELLCSTCIDISIIFRCYNENKILSNYVLIGTTSNISIYEIIKSNNFNKNNSDGVLKLLVNEKIFGKPQDVKLVSNYDNEKQFIEDILIISFDIAKYVKAKYDPIQRKLVILNLYNIEENAIGLGSINRVQFRFRSQSIGIGNIPIIAVNSSNGLICSVVYGQLLYFISNRSDIVLLSNNNRIKSKIISNKHSNYPLESQVQNQFIIDVQISLKLYGPIIDACFVNGYNKPALAILQDTGIVPVGHLLKVKHTYQVSILAVDELTQNVSILWKKTNMPHDSLRVLPYTNYLSVGVLVISMNGILYVTETDCNSIGTNAFANVSINSNHKLEMSTLSIPLELDCSNWILVKENIYIGILKDGYILLVKCVNSTFEINIIGQSIYSSTFCSSFDESYWFIGSRHQDAVLLYVTMQGQNSFLSISNKRQRRQSKGQIDSSNDNLLLDVRNEELLLYGNLLDTSLDTVHTNISYDISILVIDTISVIPSIMTGLIGKANDIHNQINELDWNYINQPIELTTSPTPASYISDLEQRNSLLITAGGLINAIYKLSLGLCFNKLVSRNFIGVMNLCSVILNQSTILFLSYYNSTKVFDITLDHANNKMINIKELSSDLTGFVVKESTILSSEIYSNSSCSYIVQVFTLGIRLIKSYKSNEENEALQDMILLDSEELGGLNSPIDDNIIIADINRNSQYIVLLTNHSYSYLLKFDIQDEYITLLNTFSPSPDRYIVNVSLFYGYLPSQNSNQEVNAIKNNKASVETSIVSLIQSIESENITVDELIKIEEMFLYNKTLNHHESNGISETCNEEKGNNSMEIESPSAKDKINENTNESIYLVIVMSDSVVDILNIDDNLKKLNNLHNDNVAIENKVISSRLEWIGHPSIDHFDRFLCLISMLDTGDCIAYQGIINNNGITYWSKIKHNFITRPKKLLKAKKHLNNTYRLYTTVDSNNYKIIVLSGITQPFSIKCQSGYPIILPLTLPELPFNNGGIMHITTLSVDSSIHGIITLWIESSMDDYNYNISTNKINYNNKQSLLGFYLEQTDLTIIPGSTITYRKINTSSKDNNIIITKFIEINKSKLMNTITNKNNEIMNQMFDRKTYIISCHNNVICSNYRTEVLTETEKEKIANDDFYYYFSDLESFYQPIIKGSGAGSPSMFFTKNLIDKQHKIIVMQYGCIVYEYYLPENEAILDTEILYLSVDKEPTNTNINIAVNKKGNKRVFVAVGTAIIDRHGEDCPSDGRLLLFSIDYIRFENNISPNIISTNTTITIANNTENLYQPNLNLISSAIGPVSIVKQFSNDRILATVGPTIFIYKLDVDTMNLEQISFYFSKFYISSVSVVKNIIVISDYGNHTDMLLWQDDDWSLTLLSKDYHKPTYNRCINTIHDHNSLAIVIGDDEKNIRIMQYNPMKEVESIQGAKLLRVADFHLGSEISLSLLHPVLSGLESTNAKNESVVNPTLSKFRMISSGQPFGSKLNKNTTSKSCNLIGTLDGQLGVILPINEQVFKRLNLLQHMIAMTIETFCLLNPKDFRVYKSNNTISIDRKKGILDGNLLYKYIELDNKTQHELASSLGTTVDVILENLYDIDMLGCFF